MKQNYTQDVVIMKEIRHALSARLTVMMILFTTQIISLLRNPSYSCVDYIKKNIKGTGSC